MQGEIKAGEEGLRQLLSLLQPNINDLQNISNQLVQVEAGISSSVMERAGSEADLASLRNITSMTSEALASNCRAVSQCIDAFNSTDAALASQMGGAMYLADSVARGILIQQAALGMGSMMLLGPIGVLGGVFGLNVGTRDLWTDLKNGIGGFFNKAKQVANFVVDNKEKILATAADLGSIVLSGLAITGSIAGATGATVATFGAGVVTYGGAAVCVTMAGNNIANKWADIWNRWDGNDSNDDQIGNTNYLKGALRNSGKYIDDNLGTDGTFEFILGTGVYGGMEVVSALHSSDNIEKALQLGASKMGAATDTASKILSSNATKQIINAAANKAGLGDNKGAIAKETLDFVSNKMSGEGIKNGEWFENLVNTGLDTYDIYTDLKGGDITNVLSNSDLLSHTSSFADNLAGTVKSPLVINY
ncbi:MAG: hypothetical protein II411_05145 [Lachnospiraceae bacterium]|nr:hypothetical protein [Lachnospiraceae bacterium]